MERRTDRGTAVLDDVADAAARPDAVDDRQDDVLGAARSGQIALDGDGHRAGTVLRQGLGGEDVLDLAGADADRERAERAVRRGVGVAADDDQPGLRVPLLGTDHVDDALAGRAHRVERDVEVLRVGGEGFHLAGADRVGDRTRGGGDVVVHGGHGEVGPADGAAVQPEALEGLRAGDLVHEVEVDVEDVGLAVGAVNDVAVPDLLSQGPRGIGLRCHGSSGGPSRSGRGSGGRSRLELVPNSGTVIPICGT